MRGGEGERRKGERHGSLGADFKEWGHPFDEITKWRSGGDSDGEIIGILPES